mmetsp:Transcript_7908/g.10876  ORF Transcript_7908/g.10876 Transcript_7908/m.10876 type:complete len:859 (-) Transcript_7908:378-2954(-)|eukprot:CAMPEP_0185733578 /NCGR_PEP_ID=MMETSP1171-20130828/20004_1 /TAXON_ID=374046 /ORGANISM="Helicotheca tamensis, Strain CCMP826" /LENGTH=858 /DNA_ID=CAMNT_0028403345 /DNA_START=62 /DNA_END=2638 /DNA_ORIENTATION=+
MSSKASLLASLTGDDAPGDGQAGDEGLRSVPIDSTGNDGITNQKEKAGTATVETEGAGLFAAGGDEEEEADLFGSIPSSSSANKTSTGGKPTGGALLAGSGLMGGDAAAVPAGGGGDGLFDAVDEEAERERIRLEEEEKERQRKILQEQYEREERERAEAAQRERERLEALERERLAALKQQEQEAAAAAAQAQLQDMSLNGRPQPPMGNQDVFYRPDPVAPQFNNPLAHHQQQPPPPQQQQQPINAGYGGSSYYYSTTGQQTHAQQQQQQQQQQHPAYQPQQPPPQQAPPPAPAAPTAPLMHGRYQHQQMTAPSMPTSPTPPAPPGGAATSVAPSTVSSVTAPSFLAGMHVGHNPNVGGVVPAQPAPRTDPSASPASAAAAAPPPVPAFQPFYGLVTVADPILVQGSGLFAGPPHWTYGITVRMNQGSRSNGPNGGGAIQVRRRFRHFVALEERLRLACPGAILPPRPDKHAARAIEEASTRQSAQFAVQRAAELENYLNGLINHPIVGSSDVVRLFLTLQDHIGVAWPEVSSSAITRLSTLSDKAATKIADGTSNVMQDLGVAQQQAAGEDNAEILALVASEGVRIGAVSQAVPKMEGTVALLRDHADRCGVVGLELSKLAKDVQAAHSELAIPLDLLSSALLRTGRRSKRLAVELSAAMTPFTLQYKLCRYERLAFADRRQALAKRTQARQKADARATKLHLHQSSLQTRHNIPALERMEMEAAMTDEHAGEAMREADKIGATLLEEIKRVSTTRNEEWNGSVKVLASSMKEACAERVSIWESVREQFEVEFPDMVVAPPSGGGGGNNPLPNPSAPPQSESGKSNDLPANVMVDNGQASSAVSYSTNGVPSAVQG